MHLPPRVPRWRAPRRLSLCLSVSQRLSSPELRIASLSSHCAMGHASHVCLVELIKLLNRSAHLKGERERPARGK